MYAQHARAAYHRTVPPGYHKDYDLSTKNTSVFYNPTTRQVSIAFSGTRPLHDPSYRNVLEAIIASDATTDLMITLGHGKHTARYMESVNVTKKAYDKYHKRGYQLHLTGHSLGGRMGADVSSSFKKEGIDIPADVYNPYFQESDSSTSEDYSNVTAHVNAGDPIAGPTLSVPGITVIQHTSQGPSVQAVAPIGSPAVNECTFLTQGQQESRDDRDWFNRMPGGWNPKDYVDWYKSGFDGSTTDRAEAALGTIAALGAAVVGGEAALGAEAATAARAAASSTLTEAGLMEEGLLSEEAAQLYRESGVALSDVYQDVVNARARRQQLVNALARGYASAKGGFEAVKQGFGHFNTIKSFVQGVAHHHGLHQFVQAERGHPGPQSTLVSHTFLDASRARSRINPNRQAVQPIAPVPG